MESSEQRQTDGQTDSREKTEYDNKFLQMRKSSHVGLKAEAEEAILDEGEGGVSSSAETPKLARQLTTVPPQLKLL